MALQHKFSWTMVKLPVGAPLTKIKQLLLQRNSSSSTTKSSSSSASSGNSDTVTSYAHAVEATFHAISADLELHRWLAGPADMRSGRSSSSLNVPPGPMAAAAAAIHVTASAKLAVEADHVVKDLREFNKLMGKQSELQCCITSLVLLERTRPHLECKDCVRCHSSHP
jgi:hypothetical protein